jgi:hypothetical protein
LPCTTRTQRWPRREARAGRPAALACLFAAQAVQVDLGLDRPVAAAQAGHDVWAHARAAKAQAVVGEQQRLDVDLVGPGLAQRGLLVGLALARQGSGLAAARCRRGGWAPAASPGPPRQRRTAARVRPPARCSASRRARSARLAAAPCQSLPKRRPRSCSECAFTAVPARPSTPPGPGRPPGGRARARRPGQRALQRLREVLVGARRLGQPRRVVVRQDHRAGVQRQRAAHHLARVDAGLRQRAAEHLLQLQQPVLLVEEQHREHLLRASPPSCSDT